MCYKYTYISLRMKLQVQQALQMLQMEYRESYAVLVKQFVIQPLFHFNVTLMLQLANCLYSRNVAEPLCYIKYILRGIFVKILFFPWRKSYSIFCNKYTSDSEYHPMYHVLIFKHLLFQEYQQIKLYLQHIHLAGAWFKIIHKLFLFSCVLCFLVYVYEIYVISYYFVFFIYD